MRLATHFCGDAVENTPIAWEQCACLYCGGASHTPLLETSDPLSIGFRFLIVKCNRCGLRFTNPRPDRVSIKHFYPADYRCHHAKQEDAKEHMGKADPIRALLPVQGSARLLDFGCGAGAFLRRMHALGWNVTGLDMAEPAVARIRDQYGLPVQVGTLPSPLWDAACFEAITMWQSLEHVHQPLEVLRAAHRLLTTGGRLLVAAPNFDSFASRWFGASWYGLDLPRHLTHFTPQTLHMMLGQAGFEHVEIRQQQRNSWIRHSAERHRNRFLQTRPGSGLAGWWGRLSGRAESILAVAAK
jgi:2-polyprenyl-3-methyl-5-hydroxy-6-metoxy-1,4-benzoquinol methylase